MRDQSIILQSVRTQYVIRNLETHSMELDILAERVRHFKVHKKGVNVMCEIADRIRNEGREEGKSVGRLESKIEDILELLEEFGKVPQRIVDLIRAEDNLGVLSRWHKSAARATSITEFESNM